MPHEALNILVVENHTDTRRSLQVLLRTLGHRASGAESIVAALARAGRRRFDLLLSDILLPDGDGWELLARLEAQGCRPAHAVAMSGLGQPGEVARSRAAGFELHLVKPFAPEALEPVLRRAAAGRPLTGWKPEEPSNGGPPVMDYPGEGLAQKMHDGLCQQLAAAALLQQALILRLESAEPSAMISGVADARYISRLLDDALTETRALMRELRRPAGDLG